METVDVKLPSELLRVANLEESSLSQEAARLLALELYREDKVSLGRAAELCQTPWRLSWISRRNTASPHYGIALKTWKRNVRLLTVSNRDCCSRLISACYSDQTWLHRLPQPSFPTCLYLQ